MAGIYQILRCHAQYAVLIVTWDITAFPQMARDRGYAVIRVLSTTFSEDVLALLPAACKDLQFAASIQHAGDIEATLASIRSLGGGPHNGIFEIVGLTCGCESGVELADALSARYGEGMKSNGEALSHHRRDKFLMGERVRGAGLRAARQVETAEWEGQETREISKWC